MATNHWLVKQEPSDYSWEQFVRDGGTSWTGIRNFQARNNLRAMKQRDLVFFYHSGEVREVVGAARVSREAYPDPTSPAGDWVTVDLVPFKVLNRPVPLETIKADKLLQALPMVRQSRLSVTPLSAEQFTRLLSLSETKL